MYYFKLGFWAVVWILIAAFLHYTLPQTDIARITDTYEKRMDFGDNALFWAGADTGNNATLQNRDVQFIQSILAKGGPMVYRNEDTGWGWPPYFKFDTANLQAEANDLRSTADSPNWVAIKHYGWRNEFFTIFPNAISVRSIEGPDVTIIPWFNIIFLTLLFAAFWAIRVRWRRFRRRRIDPTLDEWTDGWG
ncbi:DUF1523 family protein [Roseovarius aestuariivivens]|uniref:DUF1523 family protein n=1 Tax=Roseovarius aestuariivivens TaxID=1888910 RepID=UPI001081DE54|nr:DUF1523 family protein [Roseovarius aestuariivivens]